MFAILLGIWHELTEFSILFMRVFRGGNGAKQPCVDMVRPC